MPRADFLLSNPESGSFGPIQDVAFHDYIWLFLKANAIAISCFTMTFEGLIHPFAQARLKEQLSGSKIFEDAKMTVFEQSLMPRLSRPGARLHGWLKSSAGFRLPLRYGSKVARLTLFNLSPSDALVLELDAAACRSARTVRLMEGQVELARWMMQPGKRRRTFPHRCTSPPGFTN